MSNSSKSTGKIQQTCRVRENTMVQKGYGRLALEVQAAFADSHPGQFVMLRIPNGLDPLLRRPFSIYRLSRADASTGSVRLHILYRVVGRATRAMSALRPGDAVDVMGPLGNGFSLPESPRKKVVIAAGGIGVAPMVYLADRLIESGLTPEEAAVFIGGRSRNDLLCVEDFSALGFPVTATTDDGSAGRMCLVTDPFEQFVRAHPPEIIYACGPPAMLACVAGIAEAHRIQCQVSVETAMACGVGACLGCAVEIREDSEQYLHACLHGPVFDARKLGFNFR